MLFGRVRRREVLRGNDDERKPCAALRYPVPTYSTVSMPSAFQFERVYRREADPQVEYVYRVDVRCGPPATWWAAIERDGEFMGTAAGTIKDLSAAREVLESIADAAVIEIIDTRFSVA